MESVVNIGPLRKTTKYYETIISCQNRFNLSQEDILLLNNKLQVIIRLIFIYTNHINYFKWISYPLVNLFET